MANVFRKKEISLFDTFYPIVGPVQPMVASQFAEKQVIGDYTKDSEVIASSWIISDQRGGIGIKDMDEIKDAARCWWSTCQIATKGHIVLPVLVTDADNDTTSDAAAITEYSNELYVAFGASVRKWAESTTSWGSELNALAAVPTDALVHKDKLYYAVATDFERFDGTTWTDGATLVGSAQAARYLVEWDSKLFKIDNTGQLAYSIDEGVTWTNNALSTLPSGYFTSLFLYDNAAGEVVIHLGTKQGLYVLDFDNAEWIETRLRMPFHEYACRGATAWRDACYLPVGMSVYRYDAATVIPMGPDRDYGLPGTYRGNIVKLLPGHNALYALLDATTTEEQDLYPAGYYGDAQFYDRVGFSAVLRWDTYGWSVVYISGSTATALTAGTICTADDVYRLWFGVDKSVFYVPLEVTIQNPLEVAGFEFGASGEHITPWFDADNAVIDKLAARLRAYVDRTSSTEYAKVYYGLDYDDDVWTLLDSTTFADGQIDSDGEAEFTFASDAGVNFKAIRFKVELVRGSNTRLSPDVHWLRLTYIKLLDVRWGFNVTVDCSRNYRFKSATTLLAALKTALETRTLGQFTFKDGNGSETHRVRIADMQGVEVGGKKSEGRYQLTLIAP